MVNAATFDLQDYYSLINRQSIDKGRVPVFLFSELLKGDPPSSRCIYWESLSDGGVISTAQKQPLSHNSTRHQGPVDSSVTSWLEESGCCTGDAVKKLRSSSKSLPEPLNEVRLFLPTPRSLKQKMYRFKKALEIIINTRFELKELYTYQYLWSS